MSILTIEDEGETFHVHNKYCPNQVMDVLIKDFLNSQPPGDILQWQIDMLIITLEAAEKFYKEKKEKLGII